MSDGSTKDHKGIERANSQVLERVHCMPPGAPQGGQRTMKAKRVVGPGAYAFVMVYG